MLRKIEGMMKREVFHLSPSATVFDAACLMRDKKCEAVIVMTNGRLQGIFTSGDLVKRVTAGKMDPAKTTLGEVMTTKVDTVKPETLAIDALRMMQDCHYRHLPVVDGKRLVGIISRRDFFGQEQSIVEDEDHLSETIW